MDEFFCEHPDHLGERRVASPTHQYVATVDIMKADGTQRLARVSPRVGSAARQKGGLRLCEVCAQRLANALRDGAASLDVGAGYEAAVQGGLL